MLRNKKSGQTIIEIVVSLGLVFIVFAATASLTINSINLVLKARDETEAIYLAQDQIAVYIKNFNQSCSLPTPASVNTQDSATTFWYTISTDTNTSDFPTDSACPSCGFVPPNFIKINALVSYDAAGKKPIYQTSTYVASPSNVIQ